MPATTPPGLGGHSSSSSSSSSGGGGGSSGSSGSSSMSGGGGGSGMQAAVVGGGGVGVDGGGRRFKGEWTPEEDRRIYTAQREFGNRWCEIARQLPGRTENAVKNRWYSRRKLWLSPPGASSNNSNDGDSDGAVELRGVGGGSPDQVAFALEAA
eukprot:g4995.t1